MERLKDKKLKYLLEAFEKSLGLLIINRESNLFGTNMRWHNTNEKNLIKYLNEQYKGDNHDAE